MKYVDYIDHMGSDLTVVNAARVSFDKHRDEFDDEKDARLINYLAYHNHWTPFAHPQIQLRITVPLFVAAQLKRHVVGASLNEVSRRYVDSEPVFERLIFRRRPDKSIKQGSGSAFSSDKQRLLNDMMVGAEQVAVDTYNFLLENDVAPEQARAVLPQTMHTSWYWTASLYFWANLCTQRLEGHAQLETGAVAQEIGEIVGELFPVCWERLMKYPRSVG